MNIRTLSASALILGVLGTAAFAGNFGNPNAPAGSEVNNQNSEYLIDSVGEDATNAFAATASVEARGPLNSGDYIDETNVERNQRSSR